MRRLLSLMVVILLLCTGCVPAHPTADGRIKIVATVFPAYDFAREIAGDNADVKLLLSAGQEMHSYEPTPNDVAAIAECDIFLRIGGESEVWTDTLLASVDTSEMLVVTLMDCIPEPLREEHDHTHEAEHEEHAEEFDEHIWNSPVNAMAMVNAVRDALIRADVVHADEYSDHAEYYCNELAGIDADFRSLAAQTDDAILVVADRFPFRYLAAEYDFHYAAAFSGCSSETEPTLHALLHLTEECSTHSIDTVFYLEFSSRKIADRVCAETGARAVMLHPLHNVSAEDLEKGTSFVSLMRENYQAIKEALL